MKLLELITEQKIKYGCVMLHFDFPEINDIHKLINNEHIYDDEEGYGLENEPHVTLLYGLHDNVSNEHIHHALKNLKFDKCELHNPSLFNNEKYDVLKFDVNGNSLFKANKILTNFPHTTDYPDYHPHLTIGYLQKGMGQKYVDKIKNKPFTLTPKHMVYSKPNGDKIKFPINLI